jgi:C4-dicarboxylate-specific signal transduction histidine kinase
MPPYERPDPGSDSGCVVFMHNVGRIRNLNSLCLRQQLLQSVRQTMEYTRARLRRQQHRRSHNGRDRRLLQGLNAKWTPHVLRLSCAQSYVSWKWSVRQLLAPVTEAS